MKHPVVARGIVKIQEASPIEPEVGEGTVPVTDEDKVLVQIRVKRFFVYDGEEGARFEWHKPDRDFRTWWDQLSEKSKALKQSRSDPQVRIFTGLADAEKHAFVQRSNGILTPFGAMEMRSWMHRLGWDDRELGARAGVNAGAVRDALLMTSSATNTYPKMLHAVRIGLDAQARLEASKAKAVA